MTRLSVVASLAVLALAAAACGGGGKNGSSDTRAAPKAQHQLTDLHDIKQLRTAFDRASNEPRLIVLVSPT